MQDHTPSTRTLLKRIVITVAVVAVTVLAGWGVITVLKTLTHPQTQSNTASTILKPVEIIAAFGTESATPSLANESYVRQSDTTTIANVIFKPASSNFALSTPASTHALIAAKDTETADKTAQIRDEVSAFMKRSGYNVTDNVGTATSKDPSYVTFESGLAVCQLASSPVDKQAGRMAYYKLSCVEKTAIQAEYDATLRLLTLYKESGQPAVDYNEVTRYVKTEANKTLAILSLLNSTGGTSLLFAAVDEKWAYVGNLSEKGSESNGKYTITPQLQQAMNNPLYGDFLTKNIR